MIELDAIAAVALGGAPLTGGYGSVVKTIIGALTLTVVRNGLTIAGVPPSWSRVALGALLIAASAVSLNRSKVEIVNWVCTSLTDIHTQRSDAKSMAVFVLPMLNHTRIGCKLTCTLSIASANSCFTNAY